MQTVLSENPYVNLMNMFLTFRSDLTRIKYIFILFQRVKYLLTALSTLLTVTYYRKTFELQTSRISTFWYWESIEDEKRKNTDSPKPFSQLRTTSVGSRLNQLREIGLQRGQMLTNRLLSLLPRQNRKFLTHQSAVHQL